ncbi:MAG TPA: gluconate 2-dehydrogenase subunit 3 family protein [Candidatus Dormibacteraeota bacterium]|nr:gluconate 2-dehydrogenase subunit 3 family protein [Candidatus Dormibacteraeota bacterium]
MAYDRKQGQHQVAQSSRPDYRVEVGHAEVPVGAPRSFIVLDPARAATLTGWTATLIPSGGRRPDAGSVGAAEYIDATVHLVPALRPALLHGIDEVERLALSKTGRAFTECSADEREDVLRQFQAADDTDAFNMVSDFTYEAYYGHPTVLAALEAENGWRGTAPMSPSVITPFDQSQLERVRTLPRRYRAVDAGKGVKA